MRTTYILIIVFLIVCIGSAEIYIHQVKGPGFFEAPAISQALWIVEWLLMILTACVIGICIGWYLQEQIILLKREQLRNLLMQRDALLSKENHFHFEVDQLHKKLGQSQHDFREDYKKWTREKDRMKEELNSWQSHAEESKKKNAQLKERVEALESEIKSIKKINPSWKTIWKKHKLKRRDWRQS